ncbi:hypothetical protein GOP47_0011811 [Adiantum capillus-veneris]|uniref:Uncharacterized protein n=1 Tax=Adiantum capillus-veneris TaxID=13818 RepID=A0A9D4UTG5_ADICA|nr:hypothetical protein GOP47_0011811 [Adiantum capillus-veneris]
MASYHVLHPGVPHSAFSSTLSCASLQPVRCGRGMLAFSYRAQQQQPSETPSVSTRVDEEKEQLAAKLAAAEAEAESLKKELAARRSARDVDLARLKPATPEKRIDGMGFRETLFTGTGKESDGEPNSWGLLEAELFLSKGAPTEGSSLGGSALEDNSDEIVKRRLFIGLGITVVAVGLSFLKLPQGFVKPSKPLFFYLGPIVRLREKLKLIEDSSSDVESVRQRLQQALDPTDVSKDTFLSATGWLEGADADKAVSLTFTIFDYLNQADYNKYFEALGKPSTEQRLEFLRFSLKALQAARENIDLFLSIMPVEALQAATNNLKLVDKPILRQYLDSGLE